MVLLFSLISDSLGSVDGVVWAGVGTFKVEFQDLDFFNNIIWWRPLIRLTKQVRLQNFRNSGMNELCLISNLVCVKNLWFSLVLMAKNWAQF